MGNPINCEKLEKNLEQNLGRFDLNGLLDSLGGPRVLVGVDVGHEHGVEERRLAEAGLAHDHQGELEPAADRLAVNLP